MLEFTTEPLSGNLFAVSSNMQSTYWIEEMAWTYLTISSRDGVKKLGTFASVEDAKKEAEAHDEQQKAN